MDSGYSSLRYPTWHLFTLEERSHLHACIQWMSQTVQVPFHASSDCSVSASSQLPSSTAGERQQDVHWFAQMCCRSSFHTGTCGLRDCSSSRSSSGKLPASSFSAAGSAYVDTLARNWAAVASAFQISRHMQAAPTFQSVHMYVYRSNAGLTDMLDSRNQ